MTPKMLALSRSYLTYIRSEPSTRFSTIVARGMMGNSLIACIVIANRIRQEYDACQWTVLDESQTETLLYPPTRKEILYKLRRVLNTATGHDKLEYRHLQKCDPSGRLIEALFRVVHELGVPSLWKKGKTILIHKGPTNDPGNFRPIMWLCTLYKLYSSILAKKIVSVAVDLEWISKEQKGFLPGINGIQEHTYLLESCIGEARKSKRQLYIAWLDLRNAFGSLPHTTLKNLFISLPIPQRLKAILQRQLQLPARRRTLPEYPFNSGCSSRGWPEPDYI